ncbi:MAG: deoxyribodipyrimidine photo-lyase [Mycobacteriales bacterium]|nr:deoxyribodipyrimidine photo-lyase [Mycobacteriales bacterium]
MTTALLWFRRDLRLADHPALLAARDAGDEVVPVFVLDDALRRPSGAARLAFLYGCLRELQERTGGALRVVHGRPEDVVPRLVRETGATTVHVSSDHGPYGRGRDERVAEALGEVPLVATGSPYGVTPGTLAKSDGDPYKVFTPYSRAWRGRGLRSPALTPRSVPWSDGGLRSDGVPSNPDLVDVVLPEPGEAAALARWAQIRDDVLPDYKVTRDLPGVEGTSRLSPYLKYGCVHPRTLHADLGRGEGPTTYGTELIWRDFYADVLWRAPRSAREDLTDAIRGLEYDEGAEAHRCFTAWASGRTGYPIVDAGMRQLLGEAWMHNRVRMIVASFLTKDLHVYWTRGARHFMQHLVDGDLASNQHGWQWTAGTGTDASPYFRVFNPVTQGQRFDPTGDYIRRWVPELRDVPGKAVHEPWTLDRLPDGYPRRIVDHKAEREESLRRYAAARA